MIKYVIKNCPVCWRNHKNVCIKFIRHSAFVNSSETELYKSCKDITNCVLKRIVDKCYKATHDDLVITDDYHKTACEVAEIYGRAGLAQEILKLLEIEECE